MNAIILGVNSDIAKHIAKSLILDGWHISGVARDSCDFKDVGSIDRAVSLLARPWDLLIAAVGDLQPIGKFSSVHPDDWAAGAMVNCIGPLRMLHHLLPHRLSNASAVFFSGTNPTKTNPRYSSYSASKAMLTRAVQEIDAEIDLKCFTLAPGFVRTKIHAAHDVSGREDGVTHEQIYECLMHCISRPKVEVGGKLIYVANWLRVWQEMN